MKLGSQQAASRVGQLKQVAESYFDSLRNSHFASIPYAEKVALRAPLTPGGVDVPLKGKSEVYEKWWKPLQPALDGVTVTILGQYIHEDLSGIICEVEIRLKTPAVTLRAADRFTVDDEGRITEQENHFDPRPVTG